MEERERETAQRFNILDKVEKLEKNLLCIDGVTQVEFDLSGFYDHLNQVIFLTKYDIPLSDTEYFDKRRQLIKNVIAVAKENDLKCTGDRIEDYGEHFYFVMSCSQAWKKSL